MKPLFCTLTSADGKYDEMAVRLYRSCERFGLEFKIFRGEPASSWGDWIVQRPSTLLNILMDERRPIVSLDADTVVLQEPRREVDAALDAPGDLRAVLQKARFPPRLQPCRLRQGPRAGPPLAGVDRPVLGLRGLRMSASTAADNLGPRRDPEDR